MRLYRVFIALAIACCILGYFGLGFGLIGYGFWVIGALFVLAAIASFWTRSKAKHIPPEKT